MNLKEYELFKSLQGLDNFAISLNRLNMTINNVANHIFNVSPHKFARHPEPINDSHYFTDYINSLKDEGYINFSVKDNSKSSSFSKIDIKCSFLSDDHKCLTAKGNLLEKQLDAQLNNDKIDKYNSYPWVKDYRRNKQKQHKAIATEFHYRPGDGLPLSIRDKNKRAIINFFVLIAWYVLNIMIFYSHLKLSIGIKSIFNPNLLLLFLSCCILSPILSCIFHKMFDWVHYHIPNNISPRKENLNYYCVIFFSYLIILFAFYLIFILKIL